MARTKATLGSGARLSDFLSASLLARVVPAGWAVSHFKLEAAQRCRWITLRPSTSKFLL
jgi:hypothetical protein